MRSSVLKKSRTTTSCCGLLVGLAAFLIWAWPATAGEKVAFESQSTTLSFNPGVATATPSGNIHVKGMVAVNMVISENPLVTGRLTWEGDFNADSEMYGVGAGTGVFEVGTWALNDEEQLVFTPSPKGGVFVTKWEGGGNPVLAYEVKVIGHGIAGEVMGMQYALTGIGDAYHTTYSGQLLNPKAKK